MVRNKYGLICLLFFMVSFIANAQVAVTTGGAPTNYATLTAAFTAINNGTHTGSITITLTANHTLTASATLNASGTGSANYSSISISPNTNVTISCSLATRMIILNGADNIIFNGLNTSGRSLTLTNTHISGNAIFYFTNSASNNTITNCTITSRTPNEGTITFNGTSQNNDNNTISYCKIGGISISSGQYMGIYAENSTIYSDCSYNVNINNNEIYDFYRSLNAQNVAVYLRNGHNNWKINDNKIYLTGNVTSGANHIPIYILRQFSGSGEFEIKRNEIGFLNSTYSYNVNTSNSIIFNAIRSVTQTSNDTFNIQGNTIKNISFTSGNINNTFLGIACFGGTIFIGNEQGNIIGNNTSNGSISASLGTLSGSGTYTISYGLYVYSDGSYPVNLVRINNNTISGVNLNATTSTNPLSFWGIYSNCATDSIYNNLIGSNTVSNSIRLGNSLNTANQYFHGIFYNNSYASVIANNTIRNISLNGTGSSIDYSRFYGIFSNTGPASIRENVIRDISTNSSNLHATSQASINGIFVNFTTGSNGSVSNNQIQNLKNLNTTTANITVNGIYHANGTSTYIERNKIIDLGVNGTASGTIANGIFLVSGTANARNNFIHFNNNLTQSPRGINISGGTGHTCHYNTVLIEGTNTLTGASTCFYRSDNYVMNVQNNIFFNKRSSSGNNYSIFNNNGTFSNATINYNLHVVPNVNTTVYYAGAARTWTNYYTVQNTSDRFSWCENTTNLAATSLFTNTTTSDLTINSANSACWYVNGKGWPISGLDYDWENLSGDRSAAVTDGGTDIGADEFTTSTTPPTATASAAPAAGTTTTYTFAGKPVASIAWTAASTVPAAVSVWYYSGNNPPVPIPGKNAFNCYWRIEPSTTPSGMSYRPTLYFSDALLGAVPSTTDLRMAKNSGLTPNINNWSCACSGTTVNATTRTFVPTTPYTSFSIFTGTDINAPLPVELLSFTATKQDKDILLQWQTASEKNTERFEIERSYNGADFEYTGKSVSAADMSNTLRSYNAIDGEYTHTAAVVYYRLKIVDHDGFFEYSNIASINNLDITSPQVTIYPNPFNTTPTLKLEMDEHDNGELFIMDMLGNVISQEKIVLSKGINQITLPIFNTLKQGNYVLRLNTSINNHQFKLTKL